MNYQTILNQLKSIDILTNQYINELPKSPDKRHFEKEELVQASWYIEMVIRSVESAESSRKCAERYNIRLINNPNL